MRIKLWLEYLKGRDHLEDIRADGNGRYKKCKDKVIPVLN